MQRLTKEQAALIGLYTRCSCGPFGDIQALAEKYLKRPVWTHEFASKELWEQLQELCKDDFVAICYEEPKS